MRKKNSNIFFCLNLLLKLHNENWIATFKLGHSIDCSALTFNNINNYERIAYLFVHDITACSLINFDSLEKQLHRNYYFSFIFSILFISILRWPLFQMNLTATTCITIILSELHRMLTSKSVARFTLHRDCIWKRNKSTKVVKIL